MADVNRLYDQYDTKKLEDFKADNLDSLRDTVYLMEKNTGLIDDMIRAGVITNQLSSSGPISRTQQIIQTTYTSTGDDADFFKPGAGEVWMLLGGDTTSSGGTGSINWSLKDSDGTLALIFQTSVNGQEPIFQNSNNNNLPTPIYISDQNWLYANITAVATNIRASISFIRVR